MEVEVDAITAAARIQRPPAFDGRCFGANRGSGEQARHEQEVGGSPHDLPFLPGGTPSWRMRMISLTDAFE